jgi:hypothetical protein
LLSPTPDLRTVVEGEAQTAIRICRPRCGCRACGTIHQAPAPERPIAKGLATPGLLAHVLVAKYCDHLPLYRQCQIFARHGVELDRSTLANWVGGACWWLEPLQTRLAEHVFNSQKLFAGDTPIPVLDYGRGRSKTGRLWVCARDDRFWSGMDPPAAIYFYSPDRRAEQKAEEREVTSRVTANTSTPVSVKLAHKIIWNRLNSSVGKEFEAKAKLDRPDRLKHRWSGRWPAFVESGSLLLEYLKESRSCCRQNLTRRFYLYEIKPEPRFDDRIDSERSLLVGLRHHDARQDT